MRFIFPIIFISAALLILFTLAQPVYEEVRVLQAQDGQFEEALSRSQDLQALRERLATKYQNFSAADLERINKLLPDNIDNVRLILDIDDIARIHQMRISDIVVGENEDGIDTSVTSGGGYDTARLSFSTTGSYDRFLSFLTDLERSLRLVNIQDLLVSDNSDIGGLTFTITVEAYWLR